MNRLSGFLIALIFACSPVKGTPLIDAEVINVDMLKLNPASGSARLGLDPPIQLTATASLSDGTTRDVTLYATWTSSDDTVATAATGLVTPVHAGTATITASIGGQMATADMSVRNPIIAIADRDPGGSIDFFDAFTTGSGITPVRSIAGSATLMTAPFGIAIDGDELFEAEESANGVLVYPLDGSAGVAPLRHIAGSATGIGIAFGIAVYKNEIYVTTSNSVEVFPEDGSGNIAPTRVISGSNDGFVDPFGILVQNDLIYVANSDSSGGGRIQVFPTSGSGNLVPLQTIAGSATHLQRPIGLAIVNNELYVTDLVSLIAVFPLDANGNVAPTRWIHGPDTKMSSPIHIAVIGQQMVCPEEDTNNVLTFPLESTEDQPPTLQFSSSVTVDPLGIVAF